MVAALQPCRLFAQRPVASVVVFENVNVVPMDGARILERHSVVVREGRIVEMGLSSRLKPPPGAVRIDGRKRFLMPGLAEMHGHLPGPQVSAQEVEDLLFLFVANGVTTVRGMYGFPDHVALRQRAERGEILSPNLYVASPPLSGSTVKTPEDGARLVREHKAAGFDLLKVHEGLSLVSYDAIAATAGSESLPFAGHVPDKVGLHHVLEAKQSSIEHLDGYLEALERDDSPLKDADPETRARQLVDHVDERRIPELARITRDAGVWNVPTLALWQTFLGAATPESFRERPELKYMRKATVDQWAETRRKQIQEGPGAEVGARVLAVRDKVLKALHVAGAGVLLGSDAPQLFSVPGFSLHREMDAMVKAGLTPYQVLRAGTRSVAEYLGRPEEFGVVAVGRRADLILLDANPLENVANVARRAGVMVRGTWMPESEIQKRLQVIAAARQAP